MESLNNAFLSLYSKFRENPIFFTAFVVLALGVYIVYSQIDSLKDYFPTAAYEDAQFDASLTRDAQVNAALEDAKEFYSADGVAIGQFHNGQYDLTRLPFTKISITYYVGNLNDEEATNLYGERPISTMNKLMLDMWANKNKPICIAKETSEIEDIAYRQRMENTGIEYITLCPLTNIRDYPIGYLSVGYRNENVDKEKIDILLDYQRTLSARISGYLQEGSVREVRD